jgi:gamma-glutamyl:cysteine ligase YbdK (ATP-grasp superfamily)
MTSVPAPGADGNPLFVPGDGVLHDGYLVTAAYRGRLVGVESEFFVVDRKTLELRDCATVLERHSCFGSRVKTEIIREQVELCSNAFISLADLETQMRNDLREVAALLDGVGAMLLPVALREGGPSTWSSDPRVELLHGRLGESFQSRAGTIVTDQINVGAIDEADAFRIFRCLRSILPEILGLGAASPFRGGRPNGTASNRMVVYDEALSALPQLSGVPPALECLEDYAGFLRAQPCFHDPRTCYAYLRPMPHRGVAAEIRCIDKQASLAETLAFAALGKSVMLSRGDLPLDADCSMAAMEASRHHGVVDPDRTGTLLSHLVQFLPKDEARYFDALNSRVESGCPATWMVAEQNSLGYEGLLRRMANSLFEDICLA